MLKDGSESYFFLRRLFRVRFFLILLLLRVESDDDDESSDGSDDGGSGSNFAFDLCEIDSDRVGTSIVSGQVSIFLIFSRSSTFLFFLLIRGVLTNQEFLQVIIFPLNIFPLNYLSLHIVSLYCFKYFNINIFVQLF